LISLPPFFRPDYGIQEMLARPMHPAPDASDHFNQMIVKK